MKESQSQQSELSKISFVHNALPELALGEVDTAFTVGKGKSDKIELKFPMLVLFSDREEAEKISSAKRDMPAAVKKGQAIEIFINGKGQIIKLDGYKMERVRDGIEAAKALRINNTIPFIDKEDAGNFELFVKQLRIVMFLTDSKDINALRKAPIYNIG